MLSRRSARDGLSWGQPQPRSGINCESPALQAIGSGRGVGLSPVTGAAPIGGNYPAAVDWFNDHLFAELNLLVVANTTSWQDDSQSMLQIPSSIHLPDVHAP